MSGTGFEPELGRAGPLGRIVVFGNAARHPNEVATNYLLQTSKSVLGFWLVPFIVKRRDLIASTIGELLGAVAAGELEVVIGEVYPLGEAARAHEDTAGSAAAPGSCCSTPRLSDAQGRPSPSSASRRACCRRWRSSATRSRRRSRRRRSRSCWAVTT